MPTRRVHISIDKSFSGALSRVWLRWAVLKALDVALPKKPCQVSLAITDDDTIQRLNRQYRGLDEVTDVLSFSSLNEGAWEGEGRGPQRDNPAEAFILPLEELPDLGEVVISYPQTERQAAAVGQPVERELALLVVHGVLHLVGYDHVEPQDEALMKQREQEALAQIL